VKEHESHNGAKRHIAWTHHKVGYKIRHTKLG